MFWVFVVICQSVDSSNRGLLTRSVYFLVKLGSALIPKESAERPEKTTPNHLYAKRPKDQKTLITYHLFWVGGVWLYSIMLVLYWMGGWMDEWMVLEISESNKNIHIYTYQRTYFVYYSILVYLAACKISEPVNKFDKVRLFQLRKCSISLICLVPS